jgi:hypothetical protein
LFKLIWSFLVCFSSLLNRCFIINMSMYFLIIQLVWSDLCKCRYLSFYWKKWFYIWYMSLAWWLVPCLPFPGLPHIYFLFTVRLTNERVGVFLLDLQPQYICKQTIKTYTQFRTKKTRCCMLRRAKNTPTRSFVSRTVNRK